MYTHEMGKAFLLGWAVFGIAIVTDIIWARYTQYVAGGHRHKASVMAVGITVVTAFSWFAYHTTLWNVIPMSAGCYVGTLIGTKEKQKS